MINIKITYYSISQLIKAKYISFNSIYFRNCILKYLLHQYKLNVNFKTKIYELFIYFLCENFEYKKQFFHKHFETY